MANNRNLKAYVRYDGSGRIIAGSNIFAKSMPKLGNWKEVQTYICCNTPSLNPNCIYFTIEATEGNLDFYFQVFVVNDGGPDLAVEVTWGDGTNSTSDILAGSTDTIDHTFDNVGLFSGTLCVDDPSRVRRIDADIND